MEVFIWNALKDQWLKWVRGVGFEEIVKSNFIKVKKHPERTNQEIMFFEYKDYVWLVPFVRQENKLFLKTLYPSRKYTEKYKRGEL